MNKNHSQDKGNRFTVLTPREKDEREPPFMYPNVANKRYDTNLDIENRNKTRREDQTWKRTAPQENTWKKQKELEEMFEGLVEMAKSLDMEDIIWRKLEGKSGNNRERGNVAGDRPGPSSRKQDNSRYSHGRYTESKAWRSTARKETHTENKEEEDWSKVQHKGTTTLIKRYETKGRGKYAMASQYSLPENRNEVTNEEKTDVNIENEDWTGQDSTTPEKVDTVVIIETIQTEEETAGKEGVIEREESPSVQLFEIEIGSNEVMEDNPDKTEVTREEEEK